MTTSSLYAHSHGRYGGRSYQCWAHTQARLAGTVLPPRLVGTMPPEVAQHQEERSRHPLCIGGVGVMEKEKHKML